MLENALEVIGTHPRLFAQHCQREWLLKVLFNIEADALYQLHMCLARRCLIWLAAATGAKSGLLGLFGQGEERDLLASWASRRAGRMAIYPRRANGIDKDAIHMYIFLLYCLPALFFLQYHVFPLPLCLLQTMMFVFLDESIAEIEVNNYPIIAL
jgi:hypothetical protein